jgi:predicted metal-dependent hydrolase
MIYPDEIIRSNRKTLSISIDSFGRLIVRAPKRYGKERIFAFIQEKEDWILRKKSEIKGAGIDLPSENLDGYPLMIFGERHLLCLTDEARITFDGAGKKIYLPKQNAKERLVKWLKDNAKRILTDLTEKTAQRMGTGYQKVTVTSARSRWGCCTHDNAIRYTYRLLFVPKAVMEYVVVHELSHTLHKNHSPSFWREVEKYVPDWKEKRKWLHTHRALMEIF